jgi:enoyl-CoA hydratase
MALVELHISEQIATISLNRPESLNALNLEMTNLLIEKIEQLENDSNVKIIIVKGNGRAFSAGVDLKNTGTEGFDKEGDMMLLGRKLCNLIADSAKVTIAQVHGYCFTGALEFMLCFDLVYSTPETQFGDTHAKFGIMPRWGMSQRLPRKVGLAKAKEMSFRAMRVKGDEAERIGLVNRIFSLENIDAEVLSIAKEITSNNFQAVQVIKSLIDKGFNTSLEEGLKIEAENDAVVENLNENIKDFKK